MAEAIGSIATSGHPCRSSRRIPETATATRPLIFLLEGWNWAGGVDQSVLLDDDRCDISGSRSRRGSAVCTGRLRREGQELHGGPARRGSDREWPTTAASSPGLVYQRENLSGSDHLSTGRRHERPNNLTSPARLLSWRPVAGRQLRARHSCERDSRRE